MKVTTVKFYPLPDGNFVVSYFDVLRKERSQETFESESKATDRYNELRARKSVKDEKKNFKRCTVEELLEVFFEEVPEARLKKSPQLIRDFLQQFALFKPDELNEVKLRSFYARQKLEYDYTNHSLSTRKYQIQALFNWMKSRGIIQESPQAQIRLGKSTPYKRKPICLAPSQIEAIQEKARTLSPAFIYPMLLLVNESAIKTSELGTLEWSNLDLKNLKITIPGNTKIQKRETKLSELTVKILQRIEQSSNRVFTTLEGRPLHKGVLVRELKDFQRKAGFETDWVFRDLRHSFSVNFLKAGGDIKTLKEIMGHSHVRMTEELYGSFKVHSADFFDSAAVPGTSGQQSKTVELREF